MSILLFEKSNIKLLKEFVKKILKENPSYDN